MMMTNSLSLLFGWLLDRLIGDPPSLPHPVVFFGKTIAFGEHRLNHGSHRLLKGALLAVLLILITFLITYLLFQIPIFKNTKWGLLLTAILVFYCLAGTTLVREVKNVFRAVDISVEQGRKAVARIVGRDTSELTPQEIRTAALETLAENLNDGVIAPIFWYAFLGVPGMLTYKMVNTLDSMIAYRTPRYHQFGTFAARIDDVANFIPARLTAVLMLFANRLLSVFSHQYRNRPVPTFSFVLQHAKNHISPNSGWPEAALAAILNCRFGGPHSYFGQIIEKPFIGVNERIIDKADLKRAVKVCFYAEILMLVFGLLVLVVVNMSI